MGILVHEIVDVLEAHLDIDIADDRPGIVGITSFDGRPVEILDAAHYMRAARPNAFSRGHARRFRILLVDDKIFFRDMLAPIIMAAGYEVVTAASAGEALAMFERGIGFDAVVSDIDMPEMNGYDFARALLQDPRCAKLPVLALDAHASSAVVEAARASGMRGAVGKFDRGGLIDWLAAELDANAFGANEIERQTLRKAVA
jgi:two-component system, chemotaxis family, sensor kinase CheA